MVRAGVKKSINHESIIAVCRKFKTKRESRLPITISSGNNPWFGKSESVEIDSIPTTPSPFVRFRFNFHVNRLKIRP